MFIKEFEIRWNDLDANKHLANSAYTSYMSHTRMAFLNELGFSLNVLEEKQLGPVVFYEHMYYFREILPGSTVRVSLELMGLSKDGMFFEFHHNFYDPQGKHLAHCELIGGWIDLNNRKLTALDTELLQFFDRAEKAKSFRFLSREDTRKNAKFPKDLA
ncbi:acyl-CoA thioesterase [Robiginitalea sp. IMCC43444]|uniref:acyl-CoA thioesterase n=1 Tax=Robiginitalea sp. IMCC43444 TaxID=3459121 RepID=UPI004041B054